MYINIVKKQVNIVVEKQAQTGYNIDSDITFITINKRYKNERR